MGVGYSSCSSLSFSFPSSTCSFSYCPTISNSKTTCTFSDKSHSNHLLFKPTSKFLQTHIRKLAQKTIGKAPSSAPFFLRCGRVVEQMETQKGNDFLQKPSFDPHSIDQELVQKIAYDALVWSSLHGLVAVDRNSQVIVEKILVLFWALLQLQFLHIILINKMRLQMNKGCFLYGLLIFFSYSFQIVLIVYYLCLHLTNVIFKIMHSE